MPHKNKQDLKKKKNSLVRKGWAEQEKNIKQGQDKMDAEGGNQGKPIAQPSGTACNIQNRRSL